jgi:hypothetical protein
MMPALISREHADYSDIGKACAGICESMPVPPLAQGTTPRDTRSGFG